MAGIFQQSGDVDQLVALGTDYASLPRLLFKGKAICEHSAGGKWLCLVSRGLERTRTAPVRASRLHEKNAGLTIATRRHPHAAFTAAVRERGAAPQACRAVDSLQGHHFDRTAGVSFFAGALVFVFWSINQGISIDTLDRAAGSRWTMISVEIETHLITLGYWLFGNHDAYMVFLENDVFQNRVFHIDSFFAERLVLTGLFGLILLGLSILNFYSNMDLVGRAVVVSLLFYGLFEHGIFNLTSMFAYFSLLIAAISAQKALFRRARLSADAAHGTALRPAR